MARPHVPDQDRWRAWLLTAISWLPAGLGTWLVHDAEPHAGQENIPGAIGCTLLVPLALYFTAHATYFAFVSYRRLPEPRSIARTLELLAASSVFWSPVVVLLVTGLQHLRTALFP